MFEGDEVQPLAIYTLCFHLRLVTQVQQYQQTVYRSARGTRKCAVSFLL